LFNLITSSIFKIPKPYLPILFCLLLLLTTFNAHTAKANVQNLTLTNPSSVQLTRTGARINIEEQVTISKQNNQASISFAIPHQASDLTISINNSSIPEWSASNGELTKLSGKISLEYTSLLAKKAALQGQMSALQASVNLWSSPSYTTMSIDELSKRQSELEKIIPSLKIKMVLVTQLYADIEEQLKEFPKISHRIKIINVIVPTKLSSAKALKVHYSYTLNNCGWQPQYQFNALPEKNTVQVSLFAKIWQYSGLNWENTQITLLPLSSHNIKPAPLYPWYISELQKSNRVYASMAAPKAKMLRAIAYDSAEGNSATRMPSIQENMAFTSYNLNKRNIDEGKVEIRLNQATWNSKMIWLARPSISSDVWLTVKHKLANVSAWPAGNAAFLIDNIMIGNGSFSPIANEVTLYFGVDPRLNVKSVANMLISGKEGFIDKIKTWDWAWTYTVYNGRKSPANVKVEEPKPQLGNKEFTVKYNGKPIPQQGKDHTIFWEITVPAGKSSIINHAVTISAPSELNINPGR